MNKTGIIYGVNGPVIYLKGDPGFKISEMVMLDLRSWSVRSLV